MVKTYLAIKKLFDTKEAHASSKTIFQRYRKFQIS